MVQTAAASLTLTLESHPKAIRQALGEVVALLGRQNLSDERIGSAELVLAEALNNIAEHAYDGRADGRIELRFRCDGPELTCELIDTGRGLPQGQLPAGALRFRVESIDVSEAVASETTSDA